MADTSSLRTHKFQGPEKPMRQWRGILASLFGVETAALQWEGNAPTLEANLSDEQYDLINPLWKAFTQQHFTWKEAVEFGVPLDGEDSRAIAYISWARAEIRKAGYDPTDNEGVKYTAKIAVQMTVRQPPHRRNPVAEAILKRLGG